MATQPNTDHRLAETGHRQNTTGGRLLLIGAVLFVVGAIFVLAGSGIADFVGVALAALATPPTVAGLAMVLSGLVSKRSSQHKPFA